MSRVLGLIKSCSTRSKHPTLLINTFYIEYNNNRNSSKRNADKEY